MLITPKNYVNHKALALVTTNICASQCIRWGSLYYWSKDVHYMINLDFSMLGVW